MCSNPKLGLQNDEANEPTLTAQELIQEDCRRLIQLDQINILDGPDPDHSTNSHRTDSTEETEATALEDMGARQNMVIAARAAGVQCWDTVFTNLDAMDVFEEEVKMIKMMGFDGKSLVNPRQIDVVHKVFTPTQKEIIFAEKVVKEIDEKKAQGIGVFTVDGKMIDIAFYDGAKRTIALAKASGVYEGDL